MFRALALLNVRTQRDDLQKNFIKQKCPPKKGLHQVIREEERLTVNWKN